MIELPIHKDIVSDELRDDDDDDELPLRINLGLQILRATANILPTVVYYRFKNSKNRTALDRIILVLSLSEITSALSSAALASTVHYTRFDWNSGRISCLAYQAVVTCFQLFSSSLITFACYNQLASLFDVISRESPQQQMTSSSTTTVIGEPCPEGRRMRFGVLTACTCALFVVCLPFFGLAPEYKSGSRCRSFLLAIPSKQTEEIFFVVFVAGIMCSVLLTFSLAGCILVMVWKCYIKFSTSENEIENRGRRRTLVLRSSTIVTVAIFHFLLWFPALVSNM